MSVFIISLNVFMHINHHLGWKLYCKFARVNFAPEALTQLKRTNDKSTWQYAVVGGSVEEGFALSSHRRSCVWTLRLTEACLHALPVRGLPQFRHMQVSVIMTWPRLISGPYEMKWISRKWSTVPPCLQMKVNHFLPQSSWFIRSQTKVSSNVCIWVWALICTFVALFL